jgi:Recombinase/Recombinase zinc beta ribbon domain
MKGTFSEMELSLLRQRALEAIRLKAERGELHSLVAVGYVRGPAHGLEKDPDLRVREAIALVFRKFDELHSGRQVLRWLRHGGIALPSIQYRSECHKIVWACATYTKVLAILSNPVYAGAYVFGRTGTEVRVEDGRKRVRRVPRNMEQWRVCLWDHHDGYISRETFQRNQQRLAENANMRGQAVRGSIRNGEALLAGLLRCGHCGRKLVVAYGGTGNIYARYLCRGRDDTGKCNECISFGAYSTQREQPFQGKVNRDSTAKRTRIPRHREQTERSDAGPLPFYSDCGFAVNRLRVLRSDSPASVMR